MVMVGSYAIGCRLLAMGYRSDPDADSDSGCRIAVFIIVEPGFCIDMEGHLFNYLLYGFCCGTVGLSQ